jgi:hypothetical protein
MPDVLTPIPAGVPIVDRVGAITDFMRLRWQELINNFQLSPTVAALQHVAQTAAIITATAYTTLAAGNYRITVTLQETVADGVASSLTVTVGFTRAGIPMTHTFAALTTDAIGANDSSAWSFYADATTNITYAIAYSSNTPNKLTYNADVTVEKLA